MLEIPKLVSRFLVTSALWALTEAVAGTINGTVATGPPPAISRVHDSSTSTNGSLTNGTMPGYFGDIVSNRGMVLRMTYVLVGVSLVVLVYFVVKAVRMRGGRSKTRKYGILTNVDRVEISPLDESDDEEIDVFEAPVTRFGRNGTGNSSSRLLA